jgi:hypothetical protein
MSYQTSSWCPYTRYLPSNPDYNNGDYSVVKKTNIPPHIRDNAITAVPMSPRHGGLFSGELSNNPWNAIPVVPTMTNMIQNNLRSANPPPGATQQYIGTNRCGNNYVSMPGVYWYNPSDDSKGKYAIKCVHQSDYTTFKYQQESYMDNTLDIVNSESVLEEENYKL